MGLYKIANTTQHDPIHKFRKAFIITEYSRCDADEHINQYIFDKFKMEKNCSDLPVFVNFTPENVIEVVVTFCR